MYNKLNETNELYSYLLWLTLIEAYVILQIKLFVYVDFRASYP